jgi:hypothetical protein
MGLLLTLAVLSGAIEASGCKQQDQRRVSSETPKLNAFWRVAPSVRLSFLAIVAARLRCLAKTFNVRTSTDVQARAFLVFMAALRRCQRASDGVARDHTAHHRRLLVGDASDFLLYGGVVMRCLIHRWKSRIADANYFFVMCAGLVQSC